MTYTYDEFVIQDPGTGSFAWTKVDEANQRVDSGFAWIDGDTLVLVRDSRKTAEGSSPKSDRLPRWNRTRGYCYLEAA